MAEEEEDILCKFEMMLLKVRGDEYMVDFKLRGGGGGGVGGGESKDVFVDFFELCKSYIKKEIKTLA